MITLISGAPGTGKTAALVDLVHSKWAGHRTIYATHMEGLVVPHLTLEDPTTWHEVLPVDSVLLVDECQRFWRRDRSAKITADIQAMETHRHEGVDIYLISQNPTLISDNVRALVGRHIHLRDLGMMGRWWYEWPEATPTAQFKNAPIKRRYKLPKHIFHLYKSSSKHVKPIRSVPKQMFVLGFAVLLGSFFAFKAYSSVQGRLSPQKVTPAPAAASAPASGPIPGLPAPVQQSRSVMASMVPERIAEIIAPAPAYAGCISIGRISRQDGYKQEPRCECIDQSGKSVTVELSVCHDNTQRSGLAIPYDMTKTTTRTTVASASHAGEGAGAQVPVSGAPVGLTSQRSDVRVNQVTDAGRR